MQSRYQNEQFRLISFFLGKDEFAVNILKVHSIIKMMEITRIPRTPRFVEGVINLRGDVIPIVDLRKRFDIQPDTSNPPKLLIMEFGKKMVGFIIDDVSSVIPVNREDIIPRPPVHLEDLDDECLQGVIYNKNDEIVAMLNLEKAFSQQETELLQTIKTA